jgi:hypothetical protein
MFRRVPLPVVLLIASLLCPTELSAYVAGLRLPPHRIALIILFPWALYRLATLPGLKVRGFDHAMIAFNVLLLAVFAHHGIQYLGPDLIPSNGLVYGGSQALEGLVGYLVARVWIRDVEQFRASLKLLVAAAMAAGAIALPETLLGQHFTHDLLQGITGYVHPRDTEQRLGLTRAYGTFDHPIHLGTFCASVMALAWYSVRTSAARWGRVTAIVAATFTALSSAPLLICAVQGLFIGWDSLTRGVARRALMTWGLVGVLYFAASLVMTRSPIAFIATGMTLDSWTGYYRLVIWENGLENVWANPWIGLGLADWERPGWMASASVDAFWLVIAMRTGIPTFLLLSLAIGLLVHAVVKRGTGSAEPAVRAFARAWIFSLIALSLAACTVHLWNAVYAYFFFFLGLAGWMGDPKGGRVAVASKVIQPTSSQHPVGAERFAPRPRRAAA